MNIVGFENGYLVNLPDLTVDADGYLVKAIADVNKTQSLDTAAELTALKNELTRLRTEFAIFREKVERRIIKEYFAGLTS